MSQITAFDVSMRLNVHRCDVCGCVYGAATSGPQGCPSCLTRQRDMWRQRVDDLGFELRGKLNRARETIRKLRAGKGA